MDTPGVVDRWPLTDWLVITSFLCTNTVQASILTSTSKKTLTWQYFPDTGLLKWVRHMPGRWVGREESTWLHMPVIADHFPLEIGLFIEAVAMWAPLIPPLHQSPTGSIQSPVPTPHILVLPSGVCRRLPLPTSATPVPWGKRKVKKETKRGWEIVIYSMCDTTACVTLPHVTLQHCVVRPYGHKYVGSAFTTTDQWEKAQKWQMSISCLRCALGYAQGCFPH